MNARLKEAPPQIEARAIAAPIYDNTNLAWRSAWVHDNYEKLWDYWRAFEGECSDEDWDRFTWNQWDREMTRKQSDSNTLRHY